MSTPLRKSVSHVSRVESLGVGLALAVLEGEGIADGVAAGTFAMVEAPGRPDCILLRPYSYFSTEGPDKVGLLIRDVGKGTHALVESKPGDPIEILGPIGNSFPKVTGTVWAAAGGVGAGPFGVIANEPGLTIMFGARSDADAGFARALEKLGGTLELATDDGSAGYHGTVVDLLSHKLESGSRPDAIYTCGPTPMMAAVAAVARKHQVTCWASLEERMGCGYGVCRGCVIRDVDDQVTCMCTDGPVYPAQRIFS